MSSSQDPGGWRPATGFVPVLGPTDDDLTPASIDVSFSSADGTSHGQHLGADPNDYARYAQDYDMQLHDFQAPSTFSGLYAIPNDVDTSLMFSTQPSTLCLVPSEAYPAAGLGYSGGPSPQEDISPVDISPVAINVVGPCDAELPILDYDHMRWPTSTGRGPSQRRSFGHAERQRPTIENPHGRPRAASAAVLPSTYAVSVSTSPTHLTVSTNDGFAQGSPSPTYLSPGTWAWRSSPSTGSDPSSPSSTTSSHPSSPFIDGVAHSFDDGSTGSPAAVDFVVDGEQSLIFRPANEEIYLTRDAEHVDGPNLDELTEVNLKSFDDKLRLEVSREAFVDGQQSGANAHSAQTSEWASNVPSFDGSTIPPENYAASSGFVNPAHTFLQTHPMPRPPPDAMGLHLEASTMAQELHPFARNTHQPVRGSHQPGHSRFLSVDVVTASSAQVTGPSSAPSSSWSHRSSQSLDVGTPSGYLSVETHAYSTSAGSSRGRSMTAGVQKRRTASRRGRSHSPYLPARPLDDHYDGDLQPSPTYGSIVFVGQDVAIVPRADGIVKAVVNSEAGVQAAKRRRKYPLTPGRFVCQVCSRDFTAAHNLLHHLNAHKDVKEHVCGKCLVHFGTPQVLKRHHRTCAGGNVTTSHAS